MTLGRRINFIKACFFIYLFVFTSNFNVYASSDTVPVNDNKWHFLFAPYGWFSALNGEVTVKGRTHDINLPFSKILRNLKFAGQAHLEARYNRLTFILDPTYVKLAKNISDKFIHANLEAETLLIDAGAFYQLWASPPNPTQNFAILELLGGTRYLGVDNSIHFDELDTTLSKRVDLFSPIIGGRFRYYPNPKLELWLRGDVGGFNVDHVKSTWSTTLGLAYTVYPHVDLGIAYRALGMHFTQPQSAADIIFHGPMLGIAVYS